MYALLTGKSIPKEVSVTLVNKIWYWSEVIFAFLRSSYLRCDFEDSKGWKTLRGTHSEAILDWIWKCLQLDCQLDNRWVKDDIDWYGDLQCCRINVKTMKGMEGRYHPQLILLTFGSISGMQWGFGDIRGLVCGGWMESCEPTCWKQKLTKQCLSHWMSRRRIITALLQKGGHFTKFSCWNSCSREVLSLRMWSWWQVALVHHSMVNRPWGSGLSKLMDHGIQNLKKGFYFARKITWFRETHMTNVKSWAEDVKHI